MTLASRWVVRTAVGVILMAVGLLVARAWVVPAVVAGRLRAQFHGPARFESYWLRSGSAGVIGLALGEPGDEWLSARRVETDLSIGGFLTGRFNPRRITLDGPKVRLRFNRKGDLLTKGPFDGKAAPDGPLPHVVLRDAEVRVEQEGRPPMLIGGVSGEFNPPDETSATGPALSLASDDPTWGRWSARGRFEPDLKAGAVTLKSGPKFAAAPELTARVPFVPDEVWANVAPSGPIDVELTTTLSRTPGKPPSVRTVLMFGGTTVGLPGLAVVAEKVVGRVEVVDGLVRLDALQGSTLGGGIAASGSMDFRPPLPRLDVDLGLNRIDVASAPPGWQLGEVGATGKLSGQANLKIALRPEVADFTGSTGEAVIDDATLRGIPVKSLRFAMTAEGDDFRFESTGEKRSFRSPHPLRGRAPDGGKGRRTVGLLPSLLVALQAPAAPKPDAPKFRLPKTISTQIELEDVDLATLIGRLEALTRIKVPVPVSGHLGLKAEATIPLGTLGDLKAYTFRGKATLKGASIDGVDLGLLSGEVELDEGVLELRDLQGRLVNHPQAGPAPPPAAPLAPDAPLVPGTFRGRLRAELAPAGRLNAHFDGVGLPIGEVVAPYFPPPTPVSGLVSVGFDAGADVARLGDPLAWSARGRVDARGIGHGGATLDSAETTVIVERGHVRLPDLSARLGGQPLRADLDVELTGARNVRGVLDVSDWAVGRVLTLIPNVPKGISASGNVDARVSVVGTLSPPTIRTDGKVEVRSAVVGPVPLGDVVANWVTEGDEVRIKEFQARPFAGRLSGAAAIPIGFARPVRLEVEFTGIDTARVARDLAGDRFRMTGVAQGRLVATVPRDLKGLSADLRVEAPALTVQGVPAGAVRATVRERGGVLEYEATADGPEGKVRFKGGLPIDGPAADGELRAAGFTLAEVWALLGFRGTPPDLRGRAAIDANLRALREDGPDGPGTGALAFGLRGNLEVRDLKWGAHVPLGNLRGVLSRSPTAWRLDEVRGDLFGGVAGGSVRGETPAVGPRPVLFEIGTDRAALAKLFAFVPGLEDRLDGFGTVRISGRMDDGLRATADVRVDRGRVAGLAIAEVRIPAELTYQPAQGAGLVQARRWSARIGGGRVAGNASARVGADRAFSADLTLTDIDVETIARAEATTAKPGSGKVNGRIALAGPDPARPQGYRGRIDLTLSDASIGEIPVIRELGRFLGAAQGGAFEEGELRATIANRRVAIEELTLAGKVIQVHATGAVGFDGGVDLAVLVNTNQLIPQTGQALVGAIPGLRGVVGRNAEALARVTAFFSNRLLKFHVGGTLKSPTVAIDPAVVVTESAVGFFSGVLKLPLGFAR